MATKKKAPPPRVLPPNALEVCGKDVIRVLSFDPGITEMGWSVIDYTRSTGTATIVKTGVLVGRKLLASVKQLKDQFTKSFCILEAYFQITKKLMTTWKPDFTVSEGAFHSKFPQAYASLILVIHTLQRASCEALQTSVYTVAPMETKKEIASDHMADKAKIKKSILENADFVFTDKDQEKDVLTEHEYDAIGHGYCFCRRILPSLCA